MGPILLIAHHQNSRSPLYLHDQPLAQGRSRSARTTMTILTSQQIVHMSSTYGLKFDNTSYFGYSRYVSWRADAAR